MLKKDIKKAYALLELERKIVGIKIVKTKEEFDLFAGNILKKPIPYCLSVKSAMKGNAIKFTKETSGCSGSTRALGLEEPTEEFFNGTEGCSLGLYSNKTVASKVAQTMKICIDKAYGVIVKPLELFEKDPDVVLIVSNTQDMMRIIQGYSYIYGMETNFKMTGNQAVCVECTVTPLIDNRINISMFCSGTRYRADWKDYEVAIGIPYNKFHNIVKGIGETVNAVELDERKKKIEEKSISLGIDDIKIIYGKTYYYNNKNS